MTPLPARHGRRRFGLLIGVALVGLALDQITKAWALRALAEGPIDLVAGVRLNLVFNSRGAFGLGGAAVPFLALAALGLVVVLALKGDAVSRVVPAVALGLVVGGAVGNLADRAFRAPGFLRGAVVDFVDLGWWPVFNVADSAITLGCLVLVMSGWRSEEQERAEAGPTGDALMDRDGGGSRRRRDS